MRDKIPDDEDPFVRSLREAGIRPPGPRRALARVSRQVRLLVLAIVLFFGLFVVLPALATNLTDWLWFREIGFERVFLTRVLASWAIGIAAAVLAFGVLYGNARASNAESARAEHFQNPVLLQLRPRRKIVHASP